METKQQGGRCFIDSLSGRTNDIHDWSGLSTTHKTAWISWISAVLRTEPDSLSLLLFTPLGAPGLTVMLELGVARSGQIRCSRGCQIGWKIRPNLATLLPVEG